MKKKLVLFFTCIVATISITYCLLNKEEKNPDHLKNKIGSYFFSIPISRFNAGNAPCVPIKIGTLETELILDLGFQGQVGISDRLLSQIEEKKYLQTTKRCGFRGIPLQENKYELPSMEIGSLIFFEPHVYEELEQFAEHSQILQEGTEPSPPEAGKIGWKLFWNSNLFLDLGNKKAAFCDSLKTLRKEGYPADSFIKIPMLLERGLIELIAFTGDHQLRCVLDTGCTWNVLNEKLPPGTTLEQAVWQPENIVEYSTFNLSRKPFGPITFNRIPIELPIHIEAMLGMPFFEAHMMFLDFDKNVIYLAKTTKDA